MNEVILASAGLDLFWAVIGIFVMRYLLKLFDRKAGFDFTEWLKGADDVSKAIYLGSRIIAVALVISAIV